MTPRVTQSRVDGHGMFTNDLHVMSMNSCDLRSNKLNSFKGVIAVISVVESDWSSV